VLGVEQDAQESQLIKAFRKAALRWHPDKNPKQKELAEKMFHQISRALELLCDPAARAAYDKVVRAKAAQSAFLIKRRATEDGKRKRFREELEARESAFIAQQKNEKTATMDLDREIERLRKEGSSLLRRERDRLEQELHRTMKTTRTDNGQKINVNERRGEQEEIEPARLQLSWRVNKDEDGNGPYDETTIRRIFEQFGTIEVVLSKKKKGSAVVEMVDPIAALRATQSPQLGLPDCPLNIKWLSTPPSVDKLREEKKTTTFGGPRYSQSQPDLEAYEAEILAAMSAEKNAR